MRKYNWIRCGNCGHKLFKLEEGSESSLRLEIKCSSCKAICLLDMRELSKSATESNYGADTRLVRASQIKGEGEL